MKPKRWLAYSIELNDLLPDYDRLVQAFAESDVPLDAAFGSNSDTGPSAAGGCRIPGMLIAIGPAVEPPRLAEIFGLLEGHGDRFLTIHADALHGKVIYIGALNLNNEPVIRVSDEILGVVHHPGATAQGLRDAVESAPKVYPMAPRGIRG